MLEGKLVLEYLLACVPHIDLKLCPPIRSNLRKE